MNQMATTMPPTSPAVMPSRAIEIQPPSRLNASAGCRQKKYESIAPVASRLPTMMPHQVSSTITFGPRNSTTAMKKTSKATKKITSENSSDDSVSHASSSNPPAIPKVMNAPKWSNEYSSASSVSPCCTS